MRYLVYAVSSLVLLGSFYYLFTIFQWSSIYQTLLESRLMVFFFGGLGALAIFVLFRALRWSILLSAVGYGNLKLHTLYLVSASSFAVSIITPFQSGELLKIEMLRKHSDIKRVDGYTTFAAERVLDLLAIICIGSISVSFLGSGFNGWWIPGVAVVLLSIVSFVIYTVALSRFASMPILKELRSAVDQIRFSKGRLVYAFLLSLLAWSVVGVGWWVCIASIDIWLSVSQTLALVSGVTLVNIASFVPGAIGVSEVSVAFALSSFGVSDVEAQAGALLIRGFAIMTILFGLISALTLFSFVDSDLAD